MSNLILEPADLKRYILALAIQAEIEGMKADNQFRESNNQSLSYNGDNFEAMAKQLRDLANKPGSEL